MGFATVAGGSRATAPSAGILASDIAVGSIVKLMESGSAVEYRVVHQGLPSSLYDSSCNGCWLLRKDIHSERQWDSANSNSYKISTIHTYLNSTFLNLFDSNIKDAIKQVKIPYVNGTGGSAVGSGANGLSCKIFLLSAPEVHYEYNYIDSGEGAALSYFASCVTNKADSKRIANLNGSATSWWLRSPHTHNTYDVWLVYPEGFCGTYDASDSYGIRPALILPSNALFDADTMILKGVA